MPVKKLIERIEVGAGGAASITFSSIPQTYTHLYLVFSARSGQAGGNWTDTTLRPNNLTTNLSERALYGTGTDAGSNSSSQLTLRICSNVNTANTFSSYAVLITNYTATTAKSMSLDGVTETNASAAWQSIQAFLWNSSDPITSLVLNSEGYNYLEHTTASLYGITRGSDGTTTVS